MSVATLLPELRAAWRALLLGTPLPSAALTGAVITTNATVNASIIDGHNTAGLDFAARGFAPGDYITADGTPARLLGVSTTSLTVDTTPASAAAVAVSLPEQAWEAELYRPKAGTPFVAEVIRAVGQVPSPMSGIIKHKLLATATLFYPAGQGTLGIESMAGRLMVRFAPTTKLSRGASQGIVVQCEQSPLRQESEWVSASITATVLAWTLNN